MRGQESRSQDFSAGRLASENSSEIFGGKVGGRMKSWPFFSSALTVSVIYVGIPGVRDL